MITTYGYKVQSYDDPYLQLVERVTKMTVEAGSHASTLVDFFPICLWSSRILLNCSPNTDIVIYMPDWLPGAGFKRHAAKTKVLVREWLDRPFNMVKQQMVKLVIV